MAQESLQSAPQLQVYRRFPWAGPLPSAARPSNQRRGGSRDRSCFTTPEESELVIVLRPTAQPARAPVKPFAGGVANGLTWLVTTLYRGLFNM